MNIAIWPLAITMMAGPQIMMSFLLVTVREPIKLSLSYLLAVFLATTTGVFVASTVFTALNKGVNFSGEQGSFGKIIQIGLVGLLIYLAIKSYLNREKNEVPKWLKGVNEMKPGGAFKTGLLLIFLMPTDMVVMLTVGLNLATNNLAFWSAIPFILLTLLIASFPLLTYLLFKKRAEAFMPKVRDWMLNSSWILNIAIYLLFIFLILK